MAKYIIGLIGIIVIAVGGYYAYMTYGGSGGGTNIEAGAEDVVRAQDVTVGTGSEATPGSIVSVLYVGSFEDGTVFDSSEAHGNEPLVFQLGTPGLIAGFQIGVNGMKEGGERRMVVPPTFGYGPEDVKDAEGKVVIPGNSTLVFDVKLIKVEAAPTGTSSPATP